jgi:hypothetical protein
MKMKKLIYNFPAAILIVLAIVSCETTIDYKGPETEPKVVIYALLHPDSLISVSVSESHSVFRVPYQPRQITNAVVRLYRDETLIETLSYQVPGPVPDYYPPNPYSKYVSSTNRPEYGHEYRIEVEVPGLPKAYGETRLPAPVTVEVADTSSMDIGYGYRELTVKLRFRDPADEENFYRITASSLVGIYAGDKFEPYNPEISVGVQEADISYGALADPLIAPRQEDDFFDMSMPNMYYIFLDELIPGKEYTMRLSYNGFYPDTDYYEFMLAWFRLNTITRDLFLYLQSYSAHLQTRDNFLAEPVPVYSNVTNGLGVVGAMSTTADSLSIGEYPVDGVLYDRWYY